MYSGHVPNAWNNAAQGEGLIVAPAAAHSTNKLRWFVASWLA